MQPVQNLPEYQTLNNGVVLAFNKSTDEEVFGLFCVPGDYDDGTDLKFHIHWAPDIASTDTVTWGLEYLILTSDNDEQLTGSTTTAIVTDDAQNLAEELLQTGDITISGTGVVSGDVIQFRIFRDADASESGADDDFDDDAFLVAAHIVYMSDAVGGDSQW